MTTTGHDCLTVRTTAPNCREPHNRGTLANVAGIADYGHADYVVAGIRGRMLERP